MPAINNLTLIALSFYILPYFPWKFQVETLLSPKLKAQASKKGFICIAETGKR